MLFLTRTKRYLLTFKEKIYRKHILRSFYMRSNFNADGKECRKMNEKCFRIRKFYIPLYSLNLRG